MSVTEKQTPNSEVRNKAKGGEGFKVHGGWTQARDRGPFVSREGLSQVKYSSRGARVKCSGSCEMAAKLLSVSAVLIVLSALRGDREEVGGRGADGARPPSRLH